MLVFEDLNGTLVQFSKNPLKSIANFTKDCNYKRVVELTAEDVHFSTFLEIILSILIFQG